MKKNFLVFTVLIFAAFTFVSAQELKFDGYLNSGVGIAANDREGEDAYFKAFGVDSESNGFRFRLNGSYQNEARNAGVKFRLQGQRNISLSGYLSMPYLYGWLGFLDNKLTLTGGLVDDSTWTSADWWWNDDAGEGLGLLLKAEPIQGLNLGLGAYTISQQSGGSNNLLQVVPIGGGDSRLPNFNELMLKPEDVKYTLNAAYTIPDTFRFGAVFRTKNKAGWTATRNVDADKYTYGGREESALLQAEFRLLSIKNFTAVVVGAFDKLENFNEKGNILFSETFGYKWDNLNFGLNMVQFLYNRVNTANDNKKIDMDPGLLFNPWVSYTVDKFVPRLDMVYFSGGQSKMAGSGQQWERRGFVNKEGRKDTDDDYSVFSIRPSVKLNLDSRIFLEIGDMINIDSGNFDGAYKDSGDVNKKSLFTNVFYIDAKFSF